MTDAQKTGGAGAAMIIIGGILLAHEIHALGTTTFVGGFLLCGISALFIKNE
jgi:hypothetical protein